VVQRIPSETNKVFFGAWVTLENEAGEENSWRVVGPDEFDLASSKLSMDSPMARALLGKRLDDEVRVQSPGGEQVYCITDIRYAEP
jgi:transcription elongation factor GreB